MPYRSTSTAEYPPDGKSIGTYEQTAYEITIKTQDQIAKKKCPNFSSNVPCILLTRFPAYVNVKNKKIQYYYESSNSEFTNESVSVMKVSTLFQQKNWIRLKNYYM